MSNFFAYNDSIANIPGTSIHIYSIFLTIGFLAAFMASWIKLNRRNIPTRTLEWGVLVIAFVGIIGARVWYILNDLNEVSSFIDIVAVWRGGMAIQGGVMSGMLVGFFIFYRAAKQLEISMWVFIDCIIPNLLLGQAIGRWGNFFNQELLGANVGHPFSWLPMWMNNHLHYGLWVENPDPVDIFRQPLFLYESLLSLSGWLLLTFFVPKVGQLFSKKPWKLYPTQFVAPWKKYPLVKKDFFLPWKLISKLYQYQKFKKLSWKQAYYDFRIDEKKLVSVRKKPWKPVKTMTLNSYKNKLKNKYLAFKYHMQTHAIHLNTFVNPDHYRVTYAGVSGSLYFVFYGTIRMILEPLRDSRAIMMINNVPTTMIISGIWIIMGIILAIFAQFITPPRFRKGGWLYEKSY